MVTLLPFHVKISGTAILFLLVLLDRLCLLVLQTPVILNVPAVKALNVSAVLLPTNIGTEHPVLRHQRELSDVIAVVRKLSFWLLLIITAVIMPLLCKIVLTKERKWLRYRIMPLWLLADW